MNFIEIFENFSADFEASYEDDNWIRLKKYFTKDATYLIVDDPDSKSIGPDEIINFFKKDVTNSDRKFDTRTVVSLSPPPADGNHLSRLWQAKYTIKGVPDLVVEGESKYIFEGNLIKSIEGKLSEESIKTYQEWMINFGNKLQ